MPSGLDIPINPIAILLSPIPPSPQKSSNPASPDNLPALPPTSTADSTNNIVEAVAPALDRLQFPISLPDDEPSITITDLPTFSSLVWDVGPLLSHPNHLKFGPNHSTLGCQPCEYYINLARKK